MISFNLFFHTFCLIKINRFYSEKSKIIKQKYKNEYKFFIIFVWIFRIFPIVILISRLYRIIARVLVECVYIANKENDERAINILYEYKLNNQNFGILWNLTPSKKTNII